MNRETYFQNIADRLTADELAYVQRAYWLVKEAHRLQIRRLTGERYFEHLRRVSHMAGFDYNYTDVETITLGLLHDVIEDTFVPATVLLSLFGQNMYQMVLTLSKEIPTFHPVYGNLEGRVKIAPEVYFEKIKNASHRVRVIKGCDRLDNLKDIGSWELERRNRFIKETNDYVLPIVRETDTRIAEAIESAFLMTAFV